MKQKKKKKSKQFLYHSKDLKRLFLTSDFQYNIEKQITLKEQLFDFNSKGIEMTMNKSSIVWCYKQRLIGMVKDSPVFFTMNFNSIIIYRTYLRKIKHLRIGCFVKSALFEKELFFLI